MKTTQAIASVSVRDCMRTWVGVPQINNGDDLVYRRGSEKKLIANAHGLLTIIEQGNKND